jgi:drug/metabolite transporter (DMT)-like permease
MDPVSRRGWALFVLMGVIWGLPYLFIRIAVREVSPALLVFVRTAGGALLLAPFVVRRRAFRLLLARWKPLALYTGVELAVPWLLLFNAEKHVPSSLAALLVSTVPIVGAVLARLTGTDTLGRRRLAGLAVGILGVAALVGLDVHGSSAWAAASLAVVAAGYALGPWILARHLSEVPALDVVAGSLALCAALYAPAVAFALPTRSLSASVIGSMLTLTVVCTAIAFVFFFALITEVGALRATVITYVNPAVAVVLGVAVLGEHFGVGTGAGFVLILAGSFFATRPPRPRSTLGRRPPPATSAGTQPAPTVAEP